jgi:hypothetical protein
VGGRAEEDERHVKWGLSITKVRAIYETVQSFSHAHNISEHDKLNVLNLELVLFWL